MVSPSLQPRSLRIFTNDEINYFTCKKQKAKKITKQAVIEQKEKQELGENITIENMFNAEIQKAEKSNGTIEVEK